MHWKDSPLARRTRELKGTPLAATMEQVSRFAARQSYRVYEQDLNADSQRRLAEHRPALEPTQAKVVEGLEAQGYSIVPLTEFFSSSNGDLWSQLTAERDRFIERVEEDIAKRREKEEAKARKGKKRKGLGKGDYINRLLSKDQPPLGGDDPWLRIGVSDRVLDVVNSYFGMWSKLTYVDLWYTPPAPPGVTRVSSQRWHRDYNDAHLVKIFIYLDDVDEETGPLDYVPASTPGGEYENEWPWRPVSNDLYPPQDEFEKRIPKSAQVALTGPAGSMAFCNTSGFHRGGYVTGSRPRVMAVYNYSSPASLAALTLRNFTPEVSGDGLSEQAAFALTD
ncbi:MAG: phytanoyl-CoA dioxygenase family protein [Solirubrobacterales bacterium]